MVCACCSGTASSGDNWFSTASGLVVVVAALNLVANVLAKRFGEGERAMPRIKPPFPAVAGLYGLGAASSNYAPPGADPAAMVKFSTLASIA